MEFAGPSEDVKTVGFTGGAATCPSRPRIR